MSKYAALKRDLDDAIELKQFPGGDEKVRNIRKNQNSPEKDVVGSRTGSAGRTPYGEVEPALARSKVTMLLAIALALSLVMIWLHMVSSFLCNGEGLSCHPQYLLKIDDLTPEAKKMISVAEDALKTVSYFAKDHSVVEEEIENEMQYMDVIDTLSDHNTFQFNFAGFCRHNDELLVKKCTKSTGLDVFSSIVKDIGQQLGDVSKSDPDKMGDDLVAAYSQALNTMDKLYAKGTKLEPGFDDMNMMSMGQFHSLKTLGIYSVHLANGSYCTTFWLIGLAATLALVTASSHFHFKPAIRHSRVVVAALVVSFVSMLLLFILSVGVWRIQNILTLKLSVKLKVAVILTGLGFRLLLANLFLSISVLGLLFYIIYSKQI